MLIRNTLRCDVVLVGTGSLASDICCVMATTLQDGNEVIVAGRSKTRTRHLCEVARATARLFERAVHFHSVELDFSAADRVADFLGAACPRVVLNCASLQSPWEAQSRPSRWTSLMLTAGFGVSLPFHAVIAQRLLSAIKTAGADTVFLNACFPDAVNPFLAVSEGPVSCGVGNVATISAFLREALALGDAGTLRVLAHHAQLHQSRPGAPEVRAWLGNQELDDIQTRLVEQRALPRRDLHRVTSATAALLVSNILAGTSFRTNVPGPCGLPGGYPVKYHHGQFMLDLPRGLTLDEAVARNQRAGRGDGLISVENGLAVLTQEAAAELRPFLPEYSTVLRAAELDATHRAFEELRARLRGESDRPGVKTLAET